MASIKETFSKGITTINVKTSTMLEQNKINTHISTLENEIEELKNKAGHILWEKWAAGTFAIADVEELLVLVNQKMDEIEEEKKHAAEVYAEEQKILGTQQSGVSQTARENGASVCSSCGAQNVATSKFCTKCGTPLAK